MNSSTTEGAGVSSEEEEGRMTSDLRSNSMVSGTSTMQQNTKNHNNRGNNHNPNSANFPQPNSSWTDDNCMEILESQQQQQQRHGENPDKPNKDRPSPYSKMDKEEDDAFDDDDRQRDGNPLVPETFRTATDESSD
eukprot:scaffold5566_cov154-Amphora_coffeaeformis.AAC.4